MADDQSENSLAILQSMIDVSADRLVGLRTQCTTSSELTQQEIRTLEGKLLKLFSEQIVTKSKLKNGGGIVGVEQLKHVPSLTKWLQVVGLSQESIRGICSRIATVEELQEKSEHDLRVILEEHNARPEEHSRLCRALLNLKRYTDALRKGGGVESAEMNLFWDSWDCANHPIRGQSPRTARTRSRVSVPSEEMLMYNNNPHHHLHHHHNHQAGSAGGALIPPSSSVSSINTLNAHVPGGGQHQPPLTPPGHCKGKGSKFRTTPPARRKQGVFMGNLEMYPITKSKSHEFELAQTKTENGDISTNGTGRRQRLPTEPGPDTNIDCISPVLTSPVKSPPYSNSGGTDSDDNSISISLAVPSSPRTLAPPAGGPRGMTHHINHRFNKKFEVLKTCAYCQKPIYFAAGLKCKECKYTCHKHCKERVPASCGLPTELLKEFKKHMTESEWNLVVLLYGLHESEGGTATHGGVADARGRHGVVLSPPTGRQKSLVNSSKRKPSHPQPCSNLPPFHNQDSSSNTSSCNSSTPNSPAIPPQTLNTPQSHHKSSFNFPDVTKRSDEHAEDGCVFTDVNLDVPNLTLRKPILSSDDPSVRTTSSGGSTSTTDSDRTPARVDSQDSQVSDTDTITDEHRWPRQNSLSMREWDIPFHEVVLGNELGTGRFGTVYQGKWHGDVAVKILNMNYLEDEKTLEQFKMEVATFRKTRHENLILFMGACMKPPKLAIVTSLSKGNTLYTHIHLRKDKFNMNKTTLVAQQISQGMGYLHAKGIVHKDLKSKNIFLENGKVVITDFGLFSVTKLCFGNRKSDSLNIPPGWLCYLAPEIMRSLHAHQAHDEELPFSKASDVYAFGTVWYELLCGEWPFKGQPPEAVIWQVGKGMKQPLANLHASRDVKEILLACWKHEPQDRKDFVDLQAILEKFPKKRLARSPSHPIHLSRSAESVF
ncbi:kinase suppressor of Ras 2 isoform X2 [Aethina tumida]|uniref:kinase suppressor of Ras 2 isoform X2 n=1 Tax=Aethina tumida TaxID=116153 RepID=UPI0021482C0A|nr:kinase suppressor of Ras 2 isoform X2 [Aethina tumida]